MDCSTSGLLVHHQLPEFTQTHVHRVGDTIKPYYPLLSPSPFAFNLSQHQVFSNESALRIRWPKYWSISIFPSNQYSGLISLGVTGLSSWLSRVFSRTTIRKQQFFSTQLSLYKVEMWNSLITTVIPLQLFSSFFNFSGLSGDISWDLIRVHLNYPNSVISTCLLTNAWKPTS